MKLLRYIVNNPFDILMVLFILAPLFGAFANFFLREYNKHLLIECSKTHSIETCQELIK